MSNETVQVEYIGLKDKKVDNVAGTGTVWHGQGDVQPVSLAAWGKLSAHPEVWREASGKSVAGLSSAKVVTPPPPAPVAVPITAPAPAAASILYGADLPAIITIDGIEVQLGVVVSAAHADSGLTTEAWNALEEADRKARIESFIERAATEAAADRAKEEAEAKAKADAEAQGKRAEPLTHEQLKAELKRLGVPFKGNPSKASLQALYDEATKKA